MDKVELEQKIINFLQQLKPKKSPSEINFSITSAKQKDSKLAFFLKIKKNYDQVSQEIHEYQLLEQEETSTEGKEILAQAINELKTKKSNLVEEVKQELISQKEIKQNVVMEIRPGAGGVEAGLFARDLYRMYHKFADSRGWKVELAEARADGLGSFSFVSFLIKGKEAYKYLKNEAGVHRVQRVPITESKGRLQTSTVSVVVLPEVKDIAVKINPQDLRIETSRSGGAGGQHVNTTDSKVQITHLPTGIVATSQDGRSQHDNKEKALFILKSRLFEKYRQEQEKAIGNLRSLAIGASERAEKIRTYNWPQNRVTDHRVETSWNKLNFIIEGNLEDICDILIDYEVEKELENYQELIKTEK